MAICPFMSRPFWKNETDDDAILFEVECRGIECQAWTTDGTMAWCNLIHRD
jgi:hypothetical protein